MLRSWFRNSAVALGLVLAAVPAVADMRAVAGSSPVAIDGATELASEAVVFDSALIPALLATPVEGTLAVREWPIAPGRRADVELTRFDVYAPDARIVAVDAQGTRDVPRSPWIFFSGRDPSRPGLRILLTLDPAAGTLGGFVDSPAGRFELRRNEAGAGYRIGDAHLFMTPEERAQERQVRCGQDTLPPPLDSLFENAGANAIAPPRFAAAITTLHRATLAVDTDNEFFTGKFGGDVANYATRATNYIASLIAGMTVVYERDVLVRLVQGFTFLRLPAGGDPYAQPPTPPDGLANGAQLSEFSNYWAGNCAADGGCGGARALSMMVSGKGCCGFASGIAWIGNPSNGLCSTSTGYSFNQVFLPGGATASPSEITVVAHELGHNFSSPHTHCYAPPIDTCFTGEGGCYVGATSCPAPTTINGVPNVRGTLMSYCHGLMSCTSTAVMHSRTVQLLQPFIESKVNVCIFPLLAAARITPNTGDTAGGTPITITGTAFVAGGSLAVSLGGVPATGVTFVNSTTITAVTGAHATGVVGLSLTNGDAAVTALSSAYFYTPPPVADNFHTLIPCRIFDTRNPNGQLGGPALAANQARTFNVVNVCGVPPSATAISANVTIVFPGQTGGLSIYPGNAMFLGTSAINFRAGDVRANNGVVELATDGAGTMVVLNQSSGTVHVILDVNGYFD